MANDFYIKLPYLSWYNGKLRLLPQPVTKRLYLINIINMINVSTIYFYRTNNFLVETNLKTYSCFEK